MLSAKQYGILSLIFALLTIIPLVIVFAPPQEFPPKGPIYVNAYPSYSDSINKTEVIFRVPEKTITVDVTFKIKNDNNTHFAYVMLPYRIINCTVYPELNGNPAAFTKNLGNVTSNWMITDKGSSIVNATLELNQTLLPGYESSDSTVGIFFKINVEDSLFSIQNIVGDSKTLIYTFFGDVKGIFSSEMVPYMGAGSVSTINKPFFVQIELPFDYYFSNSQPSPIEYYIKDHSRWVMFSIDFLDGKYAQTVVCHIENTFHQSLKELLIFLIGVLSTFSISFAVAAGTHSQRKNNIDKESAPPTSDGKTSRANSIKRMALFVFIVSLFAIAGFLYAATLEANFSIFLQFVTGFISALLGILLGFLLDRASQHDSDDQNKEAFLKLIHGELEEMKTKLEIKTNKVEVFYTDIWDSAISSGIIRLFTPEQVVKISRVYKSVKTFSFESEFVKKGFEQLENLTTKQKENEPFVELRKLLELNSKNSKNKNVLLQEINNLLDEKWWR